MKLKTIITTRSSGRIEVEYTDLESYDEVKELSFHSISALCVCEGKMVIVHDTSRGQWTPIGGKIEPGESIDAATLREIKEESNMRVIRHIPLGYQTVHEPHQTIHQTRSLCIVEPYGPFVGDPDNDISEIKLVDLKDYKQYFDWGEIQDHIMKRIEGIIKTL